MNKGHLILGLFFLPGLVLAQQNSEFRLEVSPTYGDVFPYAWTPVTVEVENRSGRDRNLEVWLEVNEGRFRSYLPLSLPVSSTKRVTLYGIFPMWGSESRVLLRENGRDLKPIVPLGAGTNQMGTPVVLSVGARGGRVGNLGQVQMNSSGSRNEGQLQPITVVDCPLKPRLEELPDRWIGYQLFDFVLIQDSAIGDLRPAQCQALIDYALLGGTIGISLTKKPGLEPSPLLKELLGEAEFEEATERVFGRSDSKTWELTVSGFSIHSNEFRAWRGSRLMARRNFGRGFVGFLGFDVGNVEFQQWEGGRDFWRKVLEETPPSRRRQAMAQSQYGQDQDFRTEPDSAKLLDLSSMPSLVLLGSLMIGYLVVVGPINFFFLHRRRLHPYLLYSVPAIALAFIFITFVSGYVQNGFASLAREFTHVELYQPSGRGHAVKYLSLRPSTSRLFNIELDENSIGYPIYPNSELYQESSLTLRLEPTFRIENLQVRMWETGFIRIESLFPAQGQFRLEQKGDHLELMNNTSFDLEHCFMFLSEQGQDLGELATGRSLNFSVSDSQVATHVSQLAFFNQNRPIGNFFMEKVRQLVKGTFVGITEKDLVPVRINHRVAYDAKTTFVTFWPIRPIQDPANP